MTLPEGRKALTDDWFEKHNIIRDPENQYVVVTTVQTFRHRYVVPLDELQKENEEYIVDPKWALDAVTMQEVKEFSQEHLGENVSDMFVMTEKEVLSLFDSDNKYLSGWTKEQKLKWIRDWKENWSQNTK